MEITADSDRVSKAGPDAYFTGQVNIAPLINAPSPARLQAAKVTFDAGARTAWHTHPLGQTLIVTDGIGRAQTQGGPVRVISVGDVVWFEPGEKHWHGAALDSSMSHIALQEAVDGVAVSWLEQVEDTDYRAAPEENN